jgi:hypothetical protein
LQATSALRFGCTRRKAQKFGARGTTVKAYKAAHE